MILRGHCALEQKLLYPQDVTQFSSVFSIGYEYGRVGPASPVFVDEMQIGRGLKQRGRAWRNDAPVSRQGALLQWTSSRRIYLLSSLDPAVCKRTCRTADAEAERLSGGARIRNQRPRGVTFDISCHRCNHKSVDTMAS